MRRPKFKDTPGSIARRERRRVILKRTAAGRAKIDAVINAPEDSLTDEIDAHIDRVLEECGGSVSKAARKLGVARSTIQRRRKRRQEPA